MIKIKQCASMDCMLVAATKPSSKQKCTNNSNNHNKIHQKYNK